LSVQLARNYQHVIPRGTAASGNDRRVGHARTGRAARPTYSTPASALTYATSVLGAHDVEEVGSGAFGTTYRIADPKAARRALDVLRRLLSSKVSGEAPGSSVGVVVKVSTVGPREAWDEFLAKNTHEAQVHARLSRKDACVKLACSGRKVCAREFIPRLHLAGADAARGVYVSVMSLVPGTSLMRAAGDSGPVRARQYVAVERALASLWMLGVAHGDVHPENIMLHGDDAHVLDFGMAMVLPPQVRKAVQRAMNASPALAGSVANSAWYAKNMIGEYVNSRLRGRGYDWYNSDGKFLRSLWNRVPEAERARVPALRARAWSCGANKPRAARLTRSPVMRPKRRPV
jgi:serine/threonine protein kinase